MCDTFWLSGCVVQCARLNDFACDPRTFEKAFFGADFEKELEFGSDWASLVSSLQSRLRATGLQAIGNWLLVTQSGKLTITPNNNVKLNQ